MFNENVVAATESYSHGCSITILTPLAKLTGVARRFIGRLTLRRALVLVA